MHPNSTTIAPAAATELGHVLAVGQAANAAAERNVFRMYQAEKSGSTLSAQRQDLGTFCTYLAEVTVSRDADELYDSPEAWQGVTWGLVEGFKAWMLKQGFTISSINRKLSTVKMYAKHAGKANAIPSDELMKIQAVTGIQSDNVNERRDKTRITTKAEPVALTPKQFASMLSQCDDTPQGQRDRLLLHLLGFHGLRVGEVCALTVDCFNFDEGVLVFQRPKVKRTKHGEARQRLSTHSAVAAAAYISAGHPLPDGGLLRGSRKGGNLTDDPMTRFTVSKRITAIGEAAGISGVSAHALRHYAATDMAKRGYGINELMDWFGWNSPAMALRYIESATVAERDKG